MTALSLADLPEIEVLPPAEHDRVVPDAEHQKLFVWLQTRGHGE